MVQAVNIERFRRVPFVNPDLTLRREAADDLALWMQRSGGLLGIIPAGQIRFSPAGGLLAQDVQAAIEELDAEKADQAATLTALAGKQPADATLTALAGLATAADRLIYATGADAFALTPFTAAARALLDDADSAAMRGTLNVDAAGTAAAAVAAHEAAPDPHPQYATDAGLATKQDALVSGTNIKTVNGASLLGAGDLPITGGPITELANVTLGVAGTTLSTGTITAKRFMMVHVFVNGTAASDTPGLRFNGTAAGATSYRYHWTYNASGLTTLTAGSRAVSTDQIKIHAINVFGPPRNVTAFIRNRTEYVEKLVQFSSLCGSGSAAVHAPGAELGNGAWISAAATQITQIELMCANNMGAGTQMVVWGWD